MIKLTGVERGGKLRTFEVLGMNAELIILETTEGFPTKFQKIM